MNSVSSNKKKYLFFPIEIGLAHICRSLAIAEELVARGHTVYFALPKRKWKLFSHTTVTLVSIESYVAADDFGMNVKLFRDPKLIDRVVSEELALIDKYNPDAVIVDFRISAFAAATIRGIRTFAIFVGDGLPYGAHLPNPGLPPWAYRLFRNVFPKLYDVASRWYLNPFIKYMRNHGVHTTFDAWMRAVTYIVPEAPFYMPPASSTLQVHHTGTLGWYTFDNPIPPWLDKMCPDGRTVYVSFGGTGFDKNKPIEICMALVKKGYRVIVTTGSISNPSDYPSHPNLFVTTFLPGNIISKKIDVLVCHGGYGTMMDAIQCGVPVVAIPFNPDQILHAARMQELGLAKSLLTLSARDTYNAFTFQWKHIEEKGKQIPSSAIVQAVDELIKKKDLYQTNTRNFNAKYPSTNGASEAADIVEKGC